MQTYLEQLYSNYLEYGACLSSKRPKNTNHGLTPEALLRVEMEDAQRGRQQGLQLSTLGKVSLL